jgi:hypothetical protein
MDNKTQIEQGRISAMENYVDFSGEKRNFSSNKRNVLGTLNTADKSRYVFYSLAAVGVIYLIYKYKK